MALPLPRDFREFLKSLNSNGVEHLVVGGYAVGIYGHIRATNALDVWVKISAEDAARIEAAPRACGFASPELNAGLFLETGTVVRMGVPPAEAEQSRGGASEGSGRPRESPGIAPPIAPRP
jgi:hypothetical protein